MFKNANPLCSEKYLPFTEKRIIMNKTFICTEFELTEIRFEFHFGSLDINQQMNASDSILADVTINSKYVVESSTPKS